MSIACTSCAHRNAWPQAAEDSRPFVRGLMWLYAFLSFRAMVSAGMNLPLHGASERSSKNLPSEWFLPIMADFTIISFFSPPNNAPYCGRSPFTCFPSLRARQNTEHQRRIWYLPTAAHKPVNASLWKAGNRQQEAGSQQPAAFQRLTI